MKHTAKLSPFPEHRGASANEKDVFESKSLEDETFIVLKLCFYT